MRTHVPLTCRNTRCTSSVPQANKLASNDAQTMSEPFSFCNTCFGAPCNLHKTSIGGNAQYDLNPELGQEIRMYSDCIVFRQHTPHSSIISCLSSPSAPVQLPRFALNQSLNTSVSTSSPSVMCPPSVVLKCSPPFSSSFFSPIQSSL
jgi:hypothetical protein